MNTEELLYIEDDKKRRLYYRFTPAALISNFVPLVVILHDEGETETPEDFEYKMWNVLRPVDNFGYKQRGSSWLGEKGNFFVKELLQELILELAEEYECEEHIYLYGRGMGGYGAILHGILCKANAVFAHAPHITLSGKKEAIYDEIFTDTLSKESDLINFLNPADIFPIFYLCDNQNNTNSDMTRFVDACKKSDIKVRLDRCERSEGDKTQDLKKTLDFLERIASQV